MGKCGRVKINLPLYVWISGNKKFILNLNNYRNAHFQVLNKAKKLYAQEVAIALPRCHNFKIVFDSPVVLTYTLYQPTNRRVDVSNPLSIIDKFTCDALTELGILPDDSNKYVQSVAYNWGGVDKDWPRAELTIEGIMAIADSIDNKTAAE